MTHPYFIIIIRIQTQDTYQPLSFSAQ
ncbi:hypothetical protein F383_38999 [Gossypium arboreum]|uniref:Uncharacterized protein n=1 Tax=Gossypium arboreum TaxID=29729 RepID=A0A0B0MNC6_GOSAR|nr:hypothetical protein F383_38999 [Gossypium arboreum]